MKRKIIFCILTMLVSSFVFPQRIIKGNVSAADGIGPLPAATIMIKNSSTGVTSDFDGNYSITANVGDILVFSYIGMVTQEVAVKNQTEINVVLKEDLSELDEIVVIGYGSVSKESLTGSVEVLSGDKFEMATSTSLENSLQGNVAGLQMSSSGGQPGSNVDIRIRGIGSFNADSSPLYVIDGIPVITGSQSETDFGNDGHASNVMSTINPNDIESVSVLKDASATAIYGSRGANGVIIITTKSGRSGKMKINFSTQVGFSSPAYNNLNEPINEKDYHTLFIEGYVNDGKTVEYAQNLYDNYYPDPADTNWLDAIMRNGVTKQYNIDASGGGDKITYFASASYFDQEGIMLGSDFERLSSRLNLTAKVTDKLTITNNISVGRTTAHGATEGTSFDSPMYGAYLVPAAVPIYNEEGQFYNGHVGFMMGGANPVGKYTEDERWMKQTRIIDNISADYKITQNLNFKTAWSFDLLNIHEFEFDNGRYGDGRRVGGRADEATIENISWIGTQTLNYNKLFQDRHQIDVLLGYEAQKSERRSLRARAEGYPNPNLRTLANAANPTLATSAKSEYSFLSMFSRLSYNFDRKYYATLSYRRDGSSRFGSDNRWGNFWSVGASWVLTQEKFMTDLTWLNNLKLRASYGVTGNAGIGNYDSLSLYGFGNDYATMPGSAPSNVGNSLLTWENQHSMDIGLSLAFLNNRITSNMTYFIRKNEDLLLERPLSRTTGFSANLQNVGDMQNTGFELDVNIGIIDSEDFNWQLGANVSFVNNKITKLDEPITENLFRKEEGRNFYDYYLTQWAGVDPQTGQGLWYTDETKSVKTSDYNEAERVYVGKSALPDFFGGLNTSVRYKNFELSGQFSFVWNKYLYDYPAFVMDSDGRYTPRSTTQWNFDNRWTTPGQEALNPKWVWGNTSLSNSKNSTRALYDATYVRLRDVTFSYDLNNSVAEKINIVSMKIYLKGSNLLTWVRNKDLRLDPESGTNGMVDAFIPMAKTVTVGLNIGF
ncbi:SusC/RagA family TonB-linked outer membrane protein [Gelidibacter japonicus]|uniref:SusC/RagA family TonB-linked outer membrane protein n=1 Tax=Gelidibacter japonicus TaxID=1962232 RepID=UPI0013D12C22|nr:TonB-dependent receptor [Gelidibacter japonicus]